MCERLGTTSDRVVLGGRSMGGRMASMAAAGATGETKKGSEPFTEPLPVAGLVLISYPLHPPGKPERLRTEHLDRLRVPVLLICGDRDPFGSPEELAAAMAAVPGPVTTVTVPGAGHDLKGVDDVIVRAVQDWLAGPAPRG
jgi:predicted alpha/beta-hydrolase family hydrolase